MRALIAFDKFKDALTARDACKIAAETLAECQPTWEIETAPLADGGDGFCDTLTGFLDGSFCETIVMGPLEQPTTARFGIVSNDRLQAPARTLLDFKETTREIAIIEMAESSGIALTPLRDRSPWITTSAGLGDLLLSAIAQGADGAIIGLGGSATHDLALGALWRLGFAFLDSNGAPIDRTPTPETWPKIDRIDPSGSVLPPTFEIRLACDVENPLLGEIGAAAVFGPQKGLTPERLDEIEALTHRMAVTLCGACNANPDAIHSAGAGAAGGAAFGLQTGLGSRIVSGYELVKSWIGLESKFDRADLVLTGEGRFDASSLHGKGPGALALETTETGKQLHVFAGSLGELKDAPFPSECLNAISPPEMPLEDALKATQANLQKAISGAFANESR